LEIFSEISEDILGMAVDLRNTSKAFFMLDYFIKKKVFVVI